MVCGYCTYACVHGSSDDSQPQSTGNNIEVPNMKSFDGTGANSINPTKDKAPV